MTFGQAFMITQHNERFSYKQEIVQGYTIHHFDYNFARYEDFENPMGLLNYKAHELRGLCFVMDKHGNYKRWWMLHKFFNVNEVPSTSRDILAKKTISRVQNKEDGSVISFIRLPNGNVVAKSKYSFISDQAVMAQGLYDSDPVLQQYVKKVHDLDCQAIFELVGPSNRIVLEYKVNELILLQVRDEHGNYLTGDILRGWKTTPELNNSVADIHGIEDYQLDTKGVEGLIISYTDGTMVKAKTKEYFDLHHLLTENVHRTDKIIEIIINDDVDDLICQLPEGYTKDRDNLLALQELINNYIIKESKRINDMGKTYKMYSNKELGNDRYISKEDKSKLFLHRKGIDPNDFLRTIILKETNKKEKAEAFMERIKNE